MKIGLIFPSFPKVRHIPKLEDLIERFDKASNKEYKKRLEDFGLNLKSIKPRTSGISEQKKYSISTGLLSIASMLESEGHKVEYIQQEFLEDTGRWEDKIVKLANFDLIGISSYTWMYKKSLKIVEKLNRLNKNLITVMGGPHVTFLDKETLNDGVDIIVRGEGEETFKELCDRIENHRNLDDLKGITYKKDGKIIRNGNRNLVNLDSLPTPAFHLVPKEVRKGKFTSLSTTRGCPFNCLYCAERSFWKSIHLIFINNS